MIKTGAQIETDIFTLLESEILSIINGAVYNSAGRPTDSETEDAVVSFMGGVDGQNQEGIVNVSIYIPDIKTEDGKGRKSKDTKRCREVEAALLGIIESTQDVEYELTRKAIIQTFKENEIEQHFVNAKIQFKRTII